MELKDCAKFANENPVCYIATAEKNQPRVRAFAMWFADEGGFYFHTGSAKAICRQLKNNPRVEVCFYAPEPPPKVGRMMRVAGEAEFINDTALRARLLEERPFLKQMGIKGPQDTQLAVFRVRNGEAYFWTMENNMRESEAERIRV